jgi:hypothetical protein
MGIIGAASIQAAPANQFCRGSFGSRPYKPAIYSNGLIGVAPKIAPTNRLKPPLQITSIVVNDNSTKWRAQSCHSSSVEQHGSPKNAS